MISKEVIVNNLHGLDSKVAALLIHKASKYKCEIWIGKDERKANAKSLLGLLSLNVANGSKVFITANGEDEEKAVQELEEYLNVIEREITG